ncbi:MAG: M48 family metallopeptidase [Bacteroidetes bacterium]|nr:M48 family metallopeptidase [Bacteroidota bacterium]
MTELAKDYNSKKYNNIKLGIGIGKAAASFLLLLYFVVSGYSLYLERFLSLYIENGYLLFTAFTIILGVISASIFFPINFYAEYLLEHQYNLSNQTFGGWLWEGFKGLLVGGVIGIPLLLVFFWSLNTFLENWWLPFAIIVFVVSVILARIVPLVIMPLFYKITPIEDEDLKERIINLSEKVGMKVENVFTFNMSKNTKKANAAFTGLGKTKRILLGDTLLENFTNDEIETVIAHELGHYKHKHIVKNIAIGTFFSFITFYLIATLYSVSLDWFGFITITQIAAFPLLSLWGIIIGLVQSPVSNIISRKFEYEADEYAISSTGKTEAFIKTLEKLTDQNLGDKEPHPFVEWFFYSHPSIKKRTAQIESLKSSRSQVSG